RQVERLIVFDVPHIAVVEEPVTAADHVSALAVDIPRDVDAWQRKRRSVGQDTGLRASGVDVAHTVDALERPRVEEGTLRRIVQRRREVAALPIQLLVVGPGTKPHAVLEREIVPELPAVLRERVDVPIAELAVRFADCRLTVLLADDFRRRALRERANPADEHVRRRVASSRVVVGAEPELAGRVVIEVLLLLSALDRDAEFHPVRAGEFRELVAELQRIVMREDIVGLRPQVAYLTAAAPAVEKIRRKVWARRWSGVLDPLEGHPIVALQQDARVLEAIVERQTAEADEGFVRHRRTQHRDEVARVRTADVLADIWRWKCDNIPRCPPHAAWALRRFGIVGGADVRLRAVADVPVEPRLEIRPVRRLQPAVHVVVQVFRIVVVHVWIQPREILDE